MVLKTEFAEPKGGSQSLKNDTSTPLFTTSFYGLTIRQETQALPIHKVWGFFLKKDPISENKPLYVTSIFFSIKQINLILQKEMVLVINLYFPGGKENLVLNSGSQICRFLAEISTFAYLILKGEE